MDNVKAKRWLDKQMWEDREEGPLVKLVLKHLDANGRAGKVEIWSKSIEHEDECVQVPEEEIPDIVNEIHTASFDDAEGMAAGLQRYQLLAYVKHKPNAHARFSFAVRGDDVEETGNSEPSTGKGLLAQLMRHNEALMRNMVVSSGQTISQLQRTISSQGEHIENLLEDRRENFEIVEDLKSKRHERELMSLEMENKEKRYADMFEKGSMLLPAIVNRISGKKLLPENATPLEQMMTSLLESLEPEQMSRILPTLKAEQQVALIEAIEATQGDKTKQLPSKNGIN